jgi:hypothetical protein
VNGYEIEVVVHHVVFVEANSLDEAEELAIDAFLDDSNMWDEVDMDVLSTYTLVDNG